MDSSPEQDCHPHKSPYPEASTCFNRREAQAHAPRPTTFAPNATWEEFPFASTYEGGQGATLTLSPHGINSSHGGGLPHFYERNGLQDGDPYYVRTIN
jgi:large repetitive protein